MGGWWWLVACRIVLWTLDFEFGTWIWDLDLGLGLGTGLGLDNNYKFL